MNFLKNILEEKRFEDEQVELQEEYNNLFENFQALINEHQVLISEEATESINEAISKFDSNMSVGEIFDEAQRRFNTAKWAFGLTNKLKNPADKKKHRTIVLTAMNQIRLVMNQLANYLTKEIKDEEGEPDVQTTQTQRRMETRPRMSS